VASLQVLTISRIGPVNRSIIIRRLLAAVVLIAAEMAAVTALLVVAPAPASAQRFEDFFPFFQQRGRRSWFDPPEREAPPDFSKAPPPKKIDAVPQSPIMVFGDSMADWLGYGLEQAFTDNPEIGILRRHRASSGLIRAEVKNDPRGEFPDWPLAAKEMIAAQKPKFVVMMIGLNDRKQIKEVVQPMRAKPVGAAVPEPADPAAGELDTPGPRPEAAAPAPEPQGSRGTKTYEFRTDAWSEAYIRRIDDTIAALKTAGVPIFWVGLPPLRAGRGAADIPFLNDLYRSRADKAGIVYVDVWDGFVDEDGRFTPSGPDFEGQTRRLRAGDGVHFTQAGARKLAHFVEREIDRWLSAGAATAALPVEEPKPTTVLEIGAGAAAKAGAKARPLNGPTVPLTSEVSGETDELLGGNARSRMTDAVATKVLVSGEAMPVPAGRADDFAWPRRDVAPIGKDPVVATTDLPMTPMVADRRSTPGTAAAAEASPAATVATAAVQPPRRVRAADYTQYRPDYRRQQFNFFPFLFGGGR
jgi:uncharacterized protein